MGIETLFRRDHTLPGSLGTTSFLPSSSQPLDIIVIISAKNGNVNPFFAEIHE
jgi:hypothetical protein